MHCSPVRPTHVLSSQKSHYKKIRWTDERKTVGLRQAKVCRGKKGSEFHEKAAQLLSTGVDSS